MKAHPLVQLAADGLSETKEGLVLGDSGLTRVAQALAVLDGKDELLDALAGLASFAGFLADAHDAPPASAVLFGLVVSACARMKPKTASAAESLTQLSQEASKRQAALTGRERAVLPNQAPPPADARKNLPGLQFRLLDEFGSKNASPPKHKKR